MLSFLGCFSTETGTMTVGGGELRVPDAWACWRGGTVEQYSDGILGLGLGPVGLIIVLNAWAAKDQIVYQQLAWNHSTLLKIIKQNAPIIVHSGWSSSPSYRSRIPNLRQKENNTLLVSHCLPISQPSYKLHAKI